MATSTFLQATLAALLVIPVVILWVAAVVDVFRQGGSGLKIAALLVLILVVPILGPILYFVFRKDETVSAEEIQAARESLRQEAHSRPVGGGGVYR
jgi:ABC-type transport system involved in cytochrome bd biosynthesis fused ATPase/permease subunit